jgi:hypothetical protein
MSNNFKLVIAIVLMIATFIMLTFFTGTNENTFYDAMDVSSDRITTQEKVTRLSDSLDAYLNYIEEEYDEDVRPYLYNDDFNVSVMTNIATGESYPSIQLYYTTYTRSESTINMDSMDFYNLFELILFDLDENIYSDFKLEVRVSSYYDSTRSVYTLIKEPDTYPVYTMEVTNENDNLADLATIFDGNLDYIMPVDVGVSTLIITGNDGVMEYQYNSFDREVTANINVSSILSDQELLDYREQLHTLLTAFSTVEFKKGWDEVE